MLKKEKTFPFWSRLWYYVRDQKWRVVVSVVTTAFCGIMVSTQPLIVKFVVDEGINRPNADVTQKARWAAVFIGIYVAASLLRVSSFYIGLRHMVQAVEGTLFAIRSRFFRHVQGLCYKFHDEISSGELFNYIMGSPLTHIQQFLNQAGMLLPVMVISWVVSLTALVWLDPLMTSAMLLTVIVIAIVNYHSRLRIQKMTSSYMAAESTASKYVADMFHGSRTIKLHGAQDDVTSRFEGQIDNIRTKGIALARRRFLEHAKPETLNYMGMAVVFAIGTWSCLYRGMSVGTLMAFIMSLERLMSPLMQLLQMNLLRANAIAGLERIERIMNYDRSTPEPKPHERMSVQLARKASIAKGAPEFEFDNVRFAYTSAPIFKKLNCRLERGKTYGLVGTSGGGKSTFTRLLLRMYDPDCGAVRLNGCDIRRYSLKDLRAYFGVVPQDPFMFQMSILENVRIARPDATEAEVRDAMDRSLVSEFVDELPEGWATEVGESGHSLSGGQRQRVAVARAILTSPDCYIFDEATSALDTVSEYRVQHAIEDLAKDHTMIIIAHRLSTVRNVDHLFVFENGAIVQEGSYDELAVKEGKFRELLEYSEDPSRIPNLQVAKPSLMPTW